MSNDRLKDFYYREINEIKQNKLRFGAIVAALAASVALFFITDTETEVTAAADSESSKVIAAVNDDPLDDKPSNKDKSEKPASKVTSITGLERASEVEGLINPFKSDLATPPVEKKFTEPPAIPLPPSIPTPAKTVDADSQVVLILKGTAISGDKKMAIIQRSTTTKDKTKDQFHSESVMLNLGDTFEGRRIVSIGRNFIAFDDGQYLYVQEGQR